MAHPIIDIAGQKFGRWTVIEFAGRKNKATLWLCRCECGAEKIADGHSLRRGQSKGCKSCSNVTHGQATKGNQSAEYTAWCNMIARCYNPKHEYFYNYGGRGITVCDEWRQSFSAFFSHVGKRPSAGHSLDRYPNNDGNYEPGNVRWATRKQQSQNRRKPQRKAVAI